MEAESPRHTSALCSNALVLLSSRTGAPILFERFLGRRFAAPIDAGIVLRDGHRLLGRSKTWRGVAAAILVTSLAANLIGISWRLGAVVGVCAMAGDCLSSFAKRRLGFEASGAALGLDQIPKSLLPAFACAASLPLGPADLFGIVSVFTVGHLAFSRLFRIRPY